MNVISHKPSKWVLPSQWRRWEGYRITTVKSRPTLKLKGAAIPVELTERTFNEFLFWLESEFDDRLRASELAEQIGKCVTRFGSLSPTTPARRELVTVPDVPGVLDVYKTADDLRMLQIGCRMAFAIADGDAAAVSRQLLEFDIHAGRVGPRREQSYPSLSLFVGWSLDDAQRFGAPTGPAGVGLQIISWMCQEWPVPLYTAAQYDYRPIPLPQAPIHIVWFSLAHSVGAIDLPFGARIRYCAFCGKPIFSTKPRKSGSRWFCDPEEEGKRSPCQNRFFVEQSRKSKSAQSKESPQ